MTPPTGTPGEHLPNLAVDSMAHSLELELLCRTTPGDPLDNRYALLSIAAALRAVAAAIREGNLMRRQTTGEP
jgi:hypothetical protein